MREDGKLDYLELPAADLGATKAFYADAFGWTFQEMPESGGYRVIFNGERSNGGIMPMEGPSNWMPYFGHEDIDAVLVSHAHIDHCGSLPTLVRRGYPGPIFCTPATRDLMAVMLTDSARIQQEDADYLNRKRPRGEPKIQPLYEPRDVIRTLRACQTVPYDRPFEPVHGVAIARLRATGHGYRTPMEALITAAATVSELVAAPS